MEGVEGVAEARAADEAAAVFGPFAAPAKPTLGTAGLWDNPWWAAPWQSSWGQLSGAGLGRTPDAGTDASGSGSGDFGSAAEPADVDDSAAGRVLAAGLDPLVRTVRADVEVAEFAAAYAGARAEDAKRAGRAEADQPGPAAAKARSTASAAAAQRAHDNLRPAAAPGRVAVAAPSPTEIVKKTYAYGPHGTRNEMDVYRSAAAVADTAERLPTVVFVHGGSWVKGGKEHWTTIVKPFVQAGYTAVAINYRLATDAPWPAQRTDVVAAVQALKDDAALYNVDPDRIVLMGSSAGGQLVASAATWEEAPNLVRGFVSLSGPMDMFKLVANSAVGRAQETLANHVVEEFLRCQPQDCAARYDDATPARHLDPADAPSLLVASEGDWVSPEGAREFSAASNNVGVPSDFWAIPGREHGRNMWDAISQRVLDWVAHTVRED